VTLPSQFQTPAAEVVDILWITAVLASQGSLWQLRLPNLSPSA
jgi:hypothetical protein